MWRITDAGIRALQGPYLTEPQRRTLKAIRDYGDPTVGCAGELTVVLSVLLRNQLADGEQSEYPE